jgi:hypothetical protein
MVALPAPPHAASTEANARAAAARASCLIEVVTEKPPWERVE